MPTIHGVTVRPGILTAGSSGFVSIVGGDTALSDDSDSTYVQCTNLDAISLSPPTVQFPGIILPTRALSTIQISARYQQLSGDPVGRPLLTWEGEPIVAGTRTFAAAGDGVVEEDGFWNPSVDLEGFIPAYGDYSLSLFPPNAITPTTWELSFTHDISGACDFRLYELALNVQYYVPALVPPPRRQYPYPGTRVYPPVFTTRGGTAAIV